MIKDRMNKGYRMGMNIGWMLSISSSTSVYVWGNKNMQIRANFWVNYVEKKEFFLFDPELPFKLRQSLIL